MSRRRLSLVEIVAIASDGADWKEHHARAVLTRTAPSSWATATDAAETADAALGPPVPRLDADDDGFGWLEADWRHP